MAHVAAEAILDGPAGATGALGLVSPGLAQAHTGFQEARIVSLSPVATDVLAVSLQAADDAAFPPAEPGQFIVVKAQISPASPAVVRSYSLTETALPQRYELGVKCEPNGAMGSYLQHQAKAGDTIEVSAPRGSLCYGRPTGPRSS